MHSHVGILVNVAPVDAACSNQTNLKLANPREKMLEGVRTSLSQCLTAKEILKGALRQKQVLTVVIKPSI